MEHARNTVKHVLPSIPPTIPTQPKLRRTEVPATNRNTILLQTIGSIDTSRTQRKGSNRYRYRIVAKKDRFTVLRNHTSSLLQRRTNQVHGEFRRRHARFVDGNRGTQVSFRHQLQIAQKHRPSTPGDRPHGEKERHARVEKRAVRLQRTVDAANRDRVRHGQPAKHGAERLRGIDMANPTRTRGYWNALMPQSKGVQLITNLHHSNGMSIPRTEKSKHKGVGRQTVQGFAQQQGGNHGSA